MIDFEEPLVFVDDYSTGITKIIGFDKPLGLLDDTDIMTMVDFEEPLGLLSDDFDDEDDSNEHDIFRISNIEEIINMHCDMINNNPFVNIFIRNNEDKLLTNQIQEPTLNRINSSSVCYDTFNTTFDSYESFDPKLKIVSWLLKPIIEWEEEDVLLWATCISMKAKCSMFDPNVTRFSEHQLNGKYLYDMTLSKFTELLSNEEAATIFYNELQSLKDKQKWENLSETGITSEVMITLKNVQISADSSDVDMESDSVFGLLKGEIKKDYSSSGDSAIESGDESNSDGECFGYVGNGQLSSECTFFERILTDNLSVIPDVNSSATICGKGDDGKDGKPPKKRVGRPPGSKKQPKENKIGKLWENLVEWLYDDRLNPDIITWDNYEAGIFRFTDSGKAAKLWGDIKGNDQMTFEKMERAMRHHYKRKILIPYPKRLVYQFGPNATGWRHDSNIRYLKQKTNTKIF